MALGGCLGDLVCPFSATETAAVMRSGVGRSPSQFYTRCIKDPNLIPLLVTAGVEFGALRVRTAPRSVRQAKPFEHLLDNLHVQGLEGSAKAGKFNLQVEPL